MQKRKVEEAVLAEVKEDAANTRKHKFELKTCKENLLTGTINIRSNRLKYLVSFPRFHLQSSVKTV